MPTNLDALIRYKKLDQCFATGRRYTLEELAERCSEALSDKSGYTRSVSTRTIQDDIRVLRGDQLAFNAPIEVRDGLYYYAEPGEYVFRKNITGQEELKAVMEMLIMLLRETKNTELLFIIEEIDKIAQSGVAENIRNEMEAGGDQEIRLRKIPISDYAEYSNFNNLEEREIIDETLYIEETDIIEETETEFCWEEVTRALRI